MRIVLIIVLLALSASFSCSETALFSLSRSEVARFKSSRSKFVRGVIDALTHPRRLLVSILLGNEIVNVAISILFAALIYDVLAGVGWQIKILVAVVISTPLIVVIGEVIPKNIGIRFASALAPSCALFIRMFSRVMAPVRRLLLKLADKFIVMFGGRTDDIRSMIMEEEFRQMVEIGRDEGLIGDAEGELIHHVFDMADKTVEEIMTPKEGMFSVPINADIVSAMADMRQVKFARVPVYDSDPDDIVGILHLRDLFSFMRKTKVSKIRDAEDIIRPAFFVPLKTTIEQVLRDFQKMKVHMAVVVDEKRKPVGVVTMEDVFNALFEG